MSDYKSGVRSALNSYYSKQLSQGSTREPKRKNKKPELDTEKSVLAWCRLNKFDVSVVEASTYNGRSGRHGDGKVEVGFSDLVGNTQQGLACYIELKAKDRRSNVSGSQHAFLTRKIKSGCFAVVVDSDARLEKYWKQYCSLKTPDQRKAFLFDCLPSAPKPKPRNDDFEKAHGF